MKMRSSVVASVVLGTVLVGLGTLSWSALSSIREAQQTTLRVRQSGIAYSDLRGSVASEAIAEAGYRRAPSPAARARLETAIANVTTGLDRARVATDRRDGPILSQLSLLNQRYVDQVRSSLDTPVTNGNDRIAGPAVDAIQELLTATILSHRADLARASSSEIGVTLRLRWMLPTAFGLALGVVGWILRRLLADQRRVGAVADRATELAQTRAHLLDEEQRQVTMLRELERARAEFMAMVTHDLGNPITVIAGYAELIAEDDTLPPDVAKQAGAIRDRASQVRRLVDDLSRGAAPSSLDDLEPLDLAAVVAEAVAGTTAKAERSGIALTSDVSPAVINGDPDRIRQMVDNLLGNAVKYTPPGGTVHVEVQVSETQVELRVVDTGIGIPAEQLPFVFDTFYRASTATTAGIEGTGLGLAITKAIVEGHLGTIEATATEEQGTTVCVRLPLAAPVPPAEKRNPAQGSPGRDFVTSHH